MRDETAMRDETVQEGGDKMTALPDDWCDLPPLPGLYESVDGVCNDRSPKVGYGSLRPYYCTLEPGHDGPHVGHVPSGRPAAAWDDEGNQKEY